MATLNALSCPAAQLTAAAPPSAPVAPPAMGSPHDAAPRESFATALSAADDGQEAPERDDPAAAAEASAAEPQPSRSPSARPAAKGGGKKAHEDGDGAPPDGKSLPVTPAVALPVIGIAAAAPVAATGEPAPAVAGAAAVAKAVAAAGPAAEAARRLLPTAQASAPEAASAARDGAAAPIAADGTPAAAAPAVERAARATAGAALLSRADDARRADLGAAVGIPDRAARPDGRAAVPAGPVNEPAAAAPQGADAGATMAATATKLAEAGGRRMSADQQSAATPASTDTAPIAPQLRRAVVAVLATDTRVELGAAHAAAPPSVPAAMQAPAAPAAPPPAVAQLNTPVGAPDWPQQLSDRVAVLVDQNLTNAQIKLSPAHLGPIEVRIALSDGQASVSLTTHSHVTREALEAAAPRLRDALTAQGFTSVNVDVSQQQFRDRAPQPARYEPDLASTARPAAALEATTPAAGRLFTAAGGSRLDAYA